MATTPFGPSLETALKQPLQGGKLTLLKDRLIWPSFFCCDCGGGYFGVAKDPVAVLIVSPTRACAGDNVNADYSKSWSSFSTIAAWSIDWGDGNSSSGAWPDVGNVDHPAGGYSIPATYTIMLTVTDILGATGEDSQQVEIIDCTAGPGIGLFAGCGGSGVWYSGDAGISWGERGGGVLEGVEIYDLKVHPFTLGSEENELWAATVNGFYKSIDSGESWQRIVLPEPVEGHGEPSAAAIAPSKINAQEVFVVCHGSVGGINTVWLYRTIDGGVTWSWTKIRTCGTTAGAGYIESTVYGGGGSPAGSGYVRRKFAVYGGTLYTLDIAQNSFRLGVRNDVTKTWAALGGMGIRFEKGIIAGDGGPYRLWVCGMQSALSPGVHLQVWNGAAWTTLDGNRTGKRDLTRRASGEIVTTDVQEDSVRRFNNAGNYLGSFITGYPSPHGICEYNGTLFVSATAGGSGTRVRRHLGGNAWAGEDGSDSNGRFAVRDGVLFTMHGSSGYLDRRNNATQTWAQDDFRAPYITGHGYQHITGLYERDGQLYIGTDRGRVYRRDDDEYTLIGACSCDDDENDKIEVYHIIYHNNEWLASCNYDLDPGTEYRIYRLPGPTAALTVHADGRAHIIDTDAYGQYVYIGLINEDGDPVIARVNSDLTGEDIHEIYRTNAGSWGGVRCDYNNGARVWIFGDFGATKVLVSDDWGDNWTDVTDGGWAGNEVVRPVMPSIYDGGDIVAILNTALEAWHSGDAGTTWAQVGAGNTAFICHCGERDWIEDMNIFIGRLAVGANHLQFSPNNGVGWAERSGGIVPNDAPITSLQVVS